MDAAESVEDLVGAIEAAFAGVSRGQITIHEAEVLDDYGTEAERLEAHARDLEQDWRDVPGSSIAECPCALSYFDPPSWRFYLPAYMRWTLQHLKDAGCPSIDDVIYALDRGEGAPDLFEYKLQRFRTLNAAQAEAVRRVLAFASANDDCCAAVVAKRALETYWSGATGVRG